MFCSCPYRIISREQDRGTVKGSFLLVLRRCTAVIVFCTPIITYPLSFMKKFYFVRGLLYRSVIDWDHKATINRWIFSDALFSIWLKPIGLLFGNHATDNLALVLSGMNARRYPSLQKSNQSRLWTRESTGRLKVRIILN